MSQIASRAALLAAQPLPEVASVAAMTPATLSASAATAGNDPAANTASRPAAGVVGDAPSAATTGDRANQSAAAGFAAKAGADATVVTADAVPAAPVVARTTTSRTPGAITGTAQVGTPAPLPKSPANAGSLGGAVLALVLVVGLILLLAWLAKRMPGLGGAGNTSSLRIVGSLALGPRERVVVVAVGDTQLLLGVGAGGTRTLHTLAEPLPVAAAKATPAFAQLLAQHFGKKA